MPLRRVWPLLVVVLALGIGSATFLWLSLSGPRTDRLAVAIKGSTAVEQAVVRQLSAMGFDVRTDPLDSQDSFAIASSVKRQAKLLPSEPKLYEVRLASELSGDRTAGAPLWL